jgi:heat shock protein HslJ
MGLGTSAFPETGAAQNGAGVSAPKLMGPVWKWNRSSSTVVADPNRYLIEFTAEGFVGIRADCNQVSGRYRTDGAVLSITTGSSTSMACREDSQARDFLTQLRMVGSYFLRDGSLYLEFRDDGGTMTFTPSAPTGLAGTDWDVVEYIVRDVAYYNGRQLVVLKPIGSRMTLHFTADGRVSGNGGCNDFSGAYESTDSALTIRQLASTEKACLQPAGVMNQETLYLKALANATTYKIAGDRLMLRGRDGMQVIASRQPAR